MTKSVGKSRKTENEGIQKRNIYTNNRKKERKKERHRKKERTKGITQARKTLKTTALDQPIHE